MIEIVYNDFFRKKGFVLDDAYDPYKLNVFLKFYSDNNCEYINSKDVALENLKSFSGLKYLSIPDEAIHYYELSSLTDLKGVELCYSQLQYIPLRIKESIEDIVLHVGNSTVSINDLINLQGLKLDGFPGFNNTDLNFISELKLKRLSIMSKKIKALTGIKKQHGLENLIINSCSKLYDISEIASLNNLKTLCLNECNNLQNNFMDFFPCSLESLSIYGSEYYGPRCSFSTLDFLQKMKNLKVFKTNYKISSEQLISLSNTVPKIEVYGQSSKKEG